jgi:hypothetical protein
MFPKGGGGIFANIQVPYNAAELILGILKTQDLSQYNSGLVCEGGAAGGVPAGPGP